MTSGNLWPLGARSLAMTSELWQHEAGILAPPPKESPSSGGAARLSEAFNGRAGEARVGETRRRERGFTMPCLRERTRWLTIIH